MKTKKTAVVVIVALLSVVVAACVGYYTLAPRHSGAAAEPTATQAVQTEGGVVASGVSTQACAGLPPPPGWLAEKP